MLRYIVACQYTDKDTIIKLTSCNKGNLFKTIALLRVEKWAWYDDDVYSPMIPFRRHWHPYWWDILEEKCHNKLWDAIHKMNSVFKKEIDGDEDSDDFIQWLSHWASKGAYFMLVNHSTSHDNITKSIT